MNNFRVSSPSEIYSTLVKPIKPPFLSVINKSNLNINIFSNLLLSVKCEKHFKFPLIVKVETVNVWHICLKKKCSSLIFSALTDELNGNVNTVYILSILSRSSDTTYARYGFFHWAGRCCEGHRGDEDVQGVPALAECVCAWGGGQCCVSEPLGPEASL